MANGNSNILVQYEALSSASQNASQTAKWMNDNLEELQAKVKTVTGQWTGDAATSYEAKQNQWNQAQQALTQVLHLVATALENAAESYQATEKANASVWH
jgi:early secretory antigenic target protein ESAT-6